MKKFFVEKENINSKTIQIVGDEFFHLSKVLRTNVGEKIVCMCGDDYMYNCTILQINKNDAVAKIESKEVCLANPKFNITVFQGLPKGEKLELIIQKISELGANKIIPFESEFTIAKNNTIKMERLNKIAKEASKQCGRSRPLEIGETINLINIKKYLINYDLIIFLYENNNILNNINKIYNKIINSKNIAIIIGSEGGFSERENEYISSLGLEKISLGKRILRTETATIALVGYLSFLTNN